MIVIENPYDLYSFFCDVAERAFHGISQEEELPLSLTSKEARQAANRVMKELQKYDLDSVA